MKNPLFHWRTIYTTGNIIGVNGALLDKQQPLNVVRDAVYVITSSAEQKINSWVNLTKRH